MNLESPLELIELCHQQAHVAPHDPEDVAFVTLTRKDVWLFMLATLLTSATLGCLDDEYADLMERFGETIEVQKDNWRAPPQA